MATSSTTGTVGSSSAAATPFPGTTVPDLINKIWSAQLQPYIDGQVRSIKIPVPFKPIIGQHGIDEISRRFMYASLPRGAVDGLIDGRDLIGSHAIMTLQGNGIIELCKLEDQATTNMKNGSLGNGAEGDSLANKHGKIPRPPNSFILYRQQMHPLIKAANPSFSNNRICKSLATFKWPTADSLAIILGKQWKNEAQAVKDFYYKAALRIKEQHAKDFPDYCYQPRKSGEKKRRMTPRKAQRLNAIASSLLQAELPTSDGSNGVVPSFKLTSSGDLEFTLGDDNVSPDTFSSMLHSTDMMNLMAYGNARAQMHGTSVPAAVRATLERGGYSEVAVNAAQALQRHHHPLTSDRLVGVAKADLDKMNAGHRVNPITSFQPSEDTEETDLFFKVAFDLDARKKVDEEWHSELDDYFSTTSTHLELADDKTLSSNYISSSDANSQIARMESGFPGYIGF